MKVISDDQANQYREDGIWGEATLNALFSATAAAYPDRLALVDAPDRTDWTSGEPRALTYAQAEMEINRLAGFYAAVGLKTDHVIGIQAPNTVDSVIAFMAALRAELIISPLPLHWRQKNVLAALNSVGAKGFIAADRVETRMMGNAARDVAADLFTLRFVFGLGKALPDGVIELAPMLEEMGDGLVPPESSRLEAADHNATISWSRVSGKTVPVTRSHNHWISAAQMVLNESGLDGGARLVVPYALSGLTGLGGGLMPWILTGGTLHLHHPTSLAQLARHANEVEADYVLSPGPLAHLLDRGLKNPKTGIVAAWSIASPEPMPFSSQRRLVDLHVADEFALVAKARSGEEVDPFPLGQSLGSSAETGQSALVHLSTRPGETDEHPEVLMVKGGMVPDTQWPCNPTSRSTYRPKTDFLDTGIMVQSKDHNLPRFGIPGSYAQGVGDLEAIDELYGTFPGLREAAAFLVEDEILGGRLYAALVPVYGNVPDAKEFFSFLDTQGVDLAAIPHRVLVLQTLPRLDDGRVDRDRLTMRTQRVSAQVA